MKGTVAEKEDGALKTTTVNNGYRLTSALPVESSEWPRRVDLIATSGLPAIRCHTVLTV